MEIAIRGFGWADLRALLCLERECFARHAYGPTTFLYYLARCRKKFLVAEEKGQIIGYVIARHPMLRRGQHGEVVSLAVRADRRRRGVGSCLLKAGLMPLREVRVKSVSLQVNTSNRGAIAFYRKCGFKEDRILLDYYGLGDDALEMVGKLNDILDKLAVSSKENV